MLKLVPERFNELIYDKLPRTEKSDILWQFAIDKSYKFKVSKILIFDINVEDKFNVCKLYKSLITDISEINVLYKYKYFIFVNIVIWFKLSKEV